jgi:hypothetical protein
MQNLRHCLIQTKIEDWMVNCSNAGSIGREAGSAVLSGPLLFEI